jgi:coiled-coil domain-containing protein 6
MNVLSKKLEQVGGTKARVTQRLFTKDIQLREEKIELENVLEAESESHVNRLTRELSSLRLAQQQLAGIGASPAGPSDPSVEIMLAALQRENEALRSRLVDTERDYVRISRLNEVYREELLEHRNRVSTARVSASVSLTVLQLGLPVDHLIGLARPDPYSQPTHQRPQSAYSSNTSSPTNSVLHFPTTRPTNGVPIPRPAAQIRRVSSNNISEGNTPLSHSPSSSSDSPFPFSPVTSPNPTSYVSVSSNVTSPPTSYNANGVTFGAPSRGLTYPSVPPPSLSSSFGSPTVSYHMSHRDHSLSPVEPQSRRNSIRRGGGARVAESGSLWSRSTSQSRRNSMERGGRVAETGQLIPRSHPDGHTLPATTEAPDSPRMDGGIDIPPNGNSH